LNYSSKVAINSTHSLAYKKAILATSERFWCENVPAWELKGQGRERGERGILEL